MSKPSEDALPMLNSTDLEKFRLMRRAELERDEADADRVIVSGLRGTPSLPLPGNDVVSRNAQGLLEQHLPMEKKLARHLQEEVHYRREQNQHTKELALKGARSGMIISLIFVVVMLISCRSHLEFLPVVWRG